MLLCNIQSLFVLGHSILDHLGSFERVKLQLKLHTSSTTDCNAVFLFDLLVLFSFSSISFFSFRYGSNLAFGDLLFSPNGGVAELVSEFIFFSGAKFNSHVSFIIMVVSYLYLDLQFCVRKFSASLSACVNGTVSVSISSGSSTLTISSSESLPSDPSPVTGAVS